MKTKLFRNTCKAVAAMLIAIFALSGTAKAQTNYDLSIAGTWVTSDNCKDLSTIEGVSGTVKYDPENKILTLQNARIDAEKVNAIDSKIDGLTIKVVGTNYINGADIVIYFTKPTTFAGSGTLNVDSDEGCAVYINRTNLTIDGCTVNAKSGEYAVTGDGGKNENLTVKNAKLVADGKKGAVCDIATLTMEGCSITNPVGAAFDKALHGVALNGKLVTGKVVIGSEDVIEYDLTLVGTKVNEKTCNDLSKLDGVSGTVKYDHGTKTLTLENATINGEKTYAIYTSIEGLTIKVIGKNRLIGSDTTFGFEYPVTITGGGTLDVESTKRTAIFVIGTTLTIDGCTVNAKGLDYGIAGNDGESGEMLIIKNATLTAEGTEEGSICDFFDFATEGCSIVQPAGAAFSESLHGVALDGKIVKSKVVVAPKQLYILAIAGTQVSSENCSDLSVIEGVTGKASYDDATKTLTLDNATINTAKENHYGVGSGIEELTINLIGNNKIISEKGPGMYNREKCTMTFKGNGTLTVNGSTTSSKPINCKGISNRGTIVVKDCALEVSGGIDGVAAGRWKFDNCNMRVKGGGSTTDPYNGSFGYLWGAQPEFKDCKITAPAGAYWNAFVIEGNTYYTLFGSDKKAITDWVTISNNTTAIENATINTATVPNKIYTLSGVRLFGKLNDLPKGIYIVDGKKVVKK